MINYNELRDGQAFYSNGYKKGYEDAKNEFERPQGEWIEKVERRGCFASDKTVYSYTCPFCGVKEFKKFPFCHCGADMRVKDEYGQVQVNATPSRYVAKDELGGRE